VATGTAIWGILRNGLCNFREHVREVVLRICHPTTGKPVHFFPLDEAVKEEEGQEHETKAGRTHQDTEDAYRCR
jgi:hypothetical protein